MRALVLVIVLLTLAGCTAVPHPTARTAISSERAR